MGRKPRAGTEEGQSWIKVNVRLTAQEYINLREAAAALGKTMSDVAREAIKNYLIGLRLESWHVETAPYTYYPPLTQFGFNTEGEAAQVAKQIGGRVMRRKIE